MLGLPRGAPHRIATAFQAECRGFETRLPLQTPIHVHGNILPAPLFAWTARYRSGLSPRFTLELPQWATSPATA
jgi:hypothetical protein